MLALALLRLLELVDVPERPLPCLPAGDRRPLPALEPSAELSPVPSGVSDGMLAVASRAEVAMPPRAPVGADGEGVPVVAATSVAAGVARRRCLCGVADAAAFGAARRVGRDEAGVEEEPAGPGTAAAAAADAAAARPRGGRDGIASAQPGGEGSRALQTEADPTDAS